MYNPKSGSDSTLNESNVTIASILQSKIKQLGISHTQASKMLRKTTGVSVTCPHKWIMGHTRPRKKFLPAIASTLRLHLSRLQNAWENSALPSVDKKSSVGVEAKPVKEKRTNTFTPSADDVQVAIELVKTGRLKNVVKIAELIDTNFLPRGS